MGACDVMMEWQFNYSKLVMNQKQTIRYVHISSKEHNKLVTVADKQTKYKLTVLQ